MGDRDHRERFQLNIGQIQGETHFFTSFSAF